MQKDDVVAGRGCFRDRDELLFVFDLMDIAVVAAVVAQPWIR